jgi:hypothetical protein
VHLKRALLDFPWVFPYTIQKIFLGEAFRTSSGKLVRCLLPPEKTIRQFLTGKRPIDYFVVDDPYGRYTTVATTKIPATTEYFDPNAISAGDEFGDWMVDGDFRFKKFFQHHHGIAGSPGRIHEFRQLYLLNTQIKHYLALDRRDFLPIVLPNGDTIPIREFIDLPENSQKADFMGIDHMGVPRLFISYKEKSRNTPQQWGGVSRRIEPLQFFHAETQNFVEDVRRMRMRLPNSFFVRRTIRDPLLSHRAVYGVDYGHEFGVEHVQYVMIGDIRIHRYRRKFILTGRERTLFSGDAIPAPYHPVLAARTDNNRSDCGVPNTRFGIFPFQRAGVVLDV